MQFKSNFKILCKQIVMDLERFVKNRQMGEGRTRVINAKGEVIAEHFDDYGGTSIDWISATWAKK